ncbi:TIM barrel protein [Reichenbachiella sp. MALMAid0571]|uniref:sugar phosphate isomerase/epimerase family protein n=1 Tax=Reichenbachiella sp. MALMAid0571 TaxID=3143939 RepID=UPI0032E02C99
MEQKNQLILRILLLFVFFWNATTLVFGQEMVVKNPFFAFNSGVKSGGFDTFEQQATLLRKLGYDGVEKEGIEGYKEMQEAVEGKGLNIYTNYLKVDLDDLDQPFDPDIESIFKMVEGKPTMIWLYVVSKQFKPSSQENDLMAIPIFQEIADKAARYGVKIMLYPHINCWIECAEDAIRVSEKVNRRNFGMTFNLCHFLAHSYREKIDPVKRFPELAKESMPYLFAISFNGATATPTDDNHIWDSFIQPLGDGNYDSYLYLKTFLDLGFSGPVGLQTYGIKQPSDVHLKKSMDTWKKYMQKYAKKMLGHN